MSPGRAVDLKARVLTTNIGGVQICGNGRCHVDLKARVLTTNIDLDAGVCSLDLLESAAAYFALGLKAARAVIKEVATSTARWRDVAKDAGARPAEISRMASAFQHEELDRALAL